MNETLTELREKIKIQKEKSRRARLSEASNAIYVEMWLDILIIWAAHENIDLLKITANVIRNSFSESLLHIKNNEEDAKWIFEQVREKLDRKIETLSEVENVLEKG